MVEQMPETYPHQAIAAYLGTPVTVGGTYYGSLSFYNIHSRQKPFRSVEQELLRLMAQWVGSEIERQQTQDAINKQLLRTLLLGEITQAIRSSIDTEKILHATVTKVGQVFRVCRCAIHSYQVDPTPRIPCVAEYLAGDFDSLLEIEIPVAGNLHAQQVLAQDSAVVSNNVRADDRWRRCRRCAIASS
ncbi:MAG: hypothetical protein HC925_07820 [Coleofasciculaceae cyanobacterium SM2_3_26]|nr:hypothetical protein [Coleofasciculaceae cyanobacterium SM2_3_26]